MTALTDPNDPNGESRWSDDRTFESELDALAYRSNLLASDRSLVNFGGGNTSVKTRELDHMGEEIDVLWVKGSGSDLATIESAGFTGLRLAEILPLSAREAMSDEEMVAYLARCQLAPVMPRPSIETLLHAFISPPHVDHTHPDAIGAIVGSSNGEELAHLCFGEAAAWIPYLRPGFALSKLVGDALSAESGPRLVLLAKHGLVTWGETSKECYSATIEAVAQAAAFLAEAADRQPPFGGERISKPARTRREALLASVLPILRGALSRDEAKVLQVDASAPVMEFVCSNDGPTVSQKGAACPDHLVHTKRRPLWIDFDPASEGEEILHERALQGVAAFRLEESAYFDRNAGPDDVAADSSPRVILISGLGLISVGSTQQAAGLSRDLYQRAIAVMRGASAFGGFVSLDEAESFAVEYWPLELYKLSLAPPRRELQGKIALVTGAAGGIGSAIARVLSREGACVVLADIDRAGASEVAASLDPALAIDVDVTDERSVLTGFQAATLAFGGLDLVISNAGVASSAPLEETTTELWDTNHTILARGYFLIVREAARLLRAQALGGSIVFVGSKNAIVAGGGTAAYSTAKAAELHLARCAAEELGAAGIRVNTVNPDAVLQGSKIWDSSWREARARSYGISPDDLELHYRERTTLKVNVTPDDVAEAVLFFCSPRRSGKSTGNLLNVDGGVAAAYPR